MALEKSDASRSIRLLSCLLTTSGPVLTKVTAQSFLATIELSNNILYPAIYAFPTNFHKVGSTKRYAIARFGC